MLAKVGRYLVPRLLIIASLAAVASLAAFAARLWWPIELFTHFRAHYLVALLIGVATAFLVKRRKLAVVLLAVAVIDAACIGPVYLPAPVKADASSPTLRIMLINVHTANTQYEKLLAEIRRLSPDVVLTMEVNEPWVDALASFESSYLHRFYHPREDNFGIALLSRVPLKTITTKWFGSGEVPSLHATLEHEGELLHIVATHPLPPISSGYAHHRNDQLARVARFVRELDGHVVLIGDLNMTSWSPYFNDLLHVSRLRDSRRGLAAGGVQPTWPGRLAFMGIAIDHLLVSSRVAVVRRFTGRAVGSDHLPVIADVRLLPERVSQAATNPE